MAFLGYCLQYMLKINLGIAIVCMVNNTAITSLASSSFYNQSHMLYEDCPASISKKGGNHIVYFFLFFTII
jgi:hypothetical protein